ncbi:rCG46050 [Rattus norvegicus]|uniref:RCG46050 n=1 Tax=Rattus norvegicus TaxID=10116 RepID=A6IDQ5_RAT|nr:rCG46050 [Rattus norvegicus]
MSTEQQSCQEIESSSVRWLEYFESAILPSVASHANIHHPTRPHFGCFFK